MLCSSPMGSICAYEGVGTQGVDSLSLDVTRVVSLWSMWRLGTKTSQEVTKTELQIKSSNTMLSLS